VAERKIENLLGLAVLSYLTQGPMHPYQLSRTLRDNGDARSIKFNHGSLYMVVQQLARAGLIAEVETTRVGQRPERTVYGLTEPGRRELREWLRELVQEPKHEYLQYVAALSLIGALPPDDVVALLRARLRRLEDQRAEIRKLIDNAVGEGVHPLFLVEEDYRLALLDADFAFTEQLIERIENPTTGWRSQWADFHQELA
jgi:DNA-binding PadR family transcriptional regulator